MQSCCWEMLVSFSRLGVPCSLISSYKFRSSVCMVLLQRIVANVIYRFFFSSEKSTLHYTIERLLTTQLFAVLWLTNSLIIYPETPSFTLFNFSADKFHLPGYSMFSVLIRYQSTLPSADTSLKTWCQSFLNMFWDFCKRDLAFLLSLPVLY